MTTTMMTTMMLMTLIIYYAIVNDAAADDDDDDSKALQSADTKSNQLFDELDDSSGAPSFRICTMRRVAIWFYKIDE